MRKIDICAVGNFKRGIGTGLGNAFLMNCEALSACAHTEMFDFLQVRPEMEAEIGYILGLPEQFEGVRFEKGVRKIGFLLCESTVPNPAVKSAVEGVDEVWTSSNFCADVFRTAFNRPVKVVPHYAVDFAFRRKVKEDEGRTFVSVFNCDSRVKRKNPQLMIEGFKKAFGKRTKHTFIMKVMNGSPETLAELEKLADGYNIAFITEFAPWSKMAKLYQRADFLVNLHAGEGFGLPALEALACGTPVIVTGWSGTKDFVVDGVNGYEVDYKLGPCDDEYFRGEWAFPNLDSYVWTLRKAVQADLAELSRRAFESALEFSFHAAVKKTYKALYD